MTDNKIYRFKISLTGIKPMIWRRIELKDTATFWDLASAILDAMGWEGYHLMEFIVNNPKSGERLRLGVPNEDFDDVIPAWGMRIKSVLTPENNKCEFIYDFGDNWQHTVKLEKILEAKKNTDYPLCTAGKRACPPEDCGGTWGYADMLRTLNDPADEEYESVLEWVGDAFDPEYFMAEEVVFRNSLERLNEMTGGSLPPVLVENEHQDKTQTNEKPVYLKQKLGELRKPELVFLAKNQGIKGFEKLKKDELVNVLEKILPQKFEEELIYFTKEELMVFSGGFKNMLEEIDVNDLLKDVQKDLDFPMEELMENMDFLEDKMLDMNEDIVRMLINKGYIFFRGKYVDDGFDIPEEIKETYLNGMEKMGDTLLNYQAIQTYVAALANLYGVCTYSQLHKVFKKHIDSKASLKKIKDYTMKYIERSDFIEADENYFYTVALDKEEVRIIVESDLKRSYYFPTEDEMSIYNYELCGSQAQETFAEIVNYLIAHTRIEDLQTQEMTSYQESLLMEKEHITNNYENLMDDIIISARMGKGLFGLIESLDLAMCKAVSLKDLNTLYALYLELETKTRKWPLKGAFLSEL